MSELFLLSNWSNKLQYFSMNAAIDWSIWAIIYVRNVSTSLIHLPTVASIWINSTSNQNHSTCIPICNAMRAANSSRSTFCLNTPCGTLQWIWCNLPTSWIELKKANQIPLSFARARRSFNPSTRTRQQKLDAKLWKLFEQKVKKMLPNNHQRLPKFIQPTFRCRLVRLANAFRFHTEVAGKAKERFSNAAEESATQITMQNNDELWVDG